MKKKEIVDLITSLSLLILACCILLLPTFKVTDLRLILLLVFGFYTILKITQFILVFKAHDYESLCTCIISLVCALAVYFLKLSTENIALIILIWMAVMSLVKLKKADFYHDRKSNMWKLRLFMLFVFIASGLLTGINLMYSSSVQILIIGYFLFVNSVLDAIDPIAEYLMGTKNENNQ